MTKFLLPLLLLSSFISAACLANTQPHARLAIVIDDLGNSLHAGLNAIALPGDVTFAVMPHRKHSKRLAERAARLGKEVILHAPMSNINGLKLGPGALHASLSEREFKSKLTYSLESIPFATGMNNHMGSQLTTNPVAMMWVMEVLTDKQLFFLDSRTSAKSVGFITAQTMGLPSASRDIFLDNETDIEHIHLQFKKAITVAEQYGSAIAIGHPYKTTLAYLEHVLPQLAGTHIRVHKISDLLKSGISPRPDSARESKPASTPSLDAFIQRYLSTAKLEKGGNLSIVK
ncbi:MAG: divergent polysaccharide deacetylase family protein [Bermanella sp.]|mgnify:CR=1 FL=1